MLIMQLQNKYKNFNLSSFLRTNESFVWTFLGFSASNALRLLSSLILTRIFLPEQFGMMAILITLVVGAELLSDVGIQTSIIRNNNDKDTAFFKSAWTLSVIRGFILCIVLILFSNYFSQLFKSELLQQYIAVISLIFIIKGFRSTSFALHVKQKKIKILTKLELSTQLLALITTLTLAIYFQSLWAFIASMIFTEIVFTISTFYYLKGGTTGFMFSKKHISGMTKFGKWLFLASILTFITGQGDRFLLGIYLTKEELGVYHVAATLAALPIMLHGALLNKIFFPSVCEKLDNPIDEFNVAFNQLRIKVVLLTFPIAAFLALFGSEIIIFMYNINYQNAGIILQILSVGAMLKITGDSISPILNAKGDSFRHMLYIGFWAFLIIASIILGNYLFQFNGILIGMAITPFFSLIVISLLAKKYVQLNHLLSLALTILSLLTLIFVTRIL